MLLYIIIFLGTILADIIPFLGPPAWTIMVFFQIKYQLNIWPVLFCGVAGSTIGRYIFSYYFAKFAERYFKPRKNEEMQFLGEKLQQEKWGFLLFVFLYTLMPISSTPLFSATGIAHIKPLKVLPPFFFGKFISDLAMISMGSYAVTNSENLLRDYLSWQSLSGMLVALLLLCMVFFVDWKFLLINKKLRLNFRIWK